MQTIIATINPGDSGNTVVNLQDALLVLLQRQVIKTFDSPNHPTVDELKELTDQLKDERARSSFGDATRQLIRHFQIQQSLGDHLYGMVEDTTAARLNQFLKEFGLIGTATPLAVYGLVFDRRSGKPAADVVVRAFDRDGILYTILGETRSDSQGQYRIEFLEAAYRNTAAERGGPELVVRVYDANDRKIGQSKQVNNAGQLTELNVQIANATRYHVFGSVQDNAGELVTGERVANGRLRIQILDINIGEEPTLLAETVTDKTGHFRVEFVWPPGDDVKKHSPDLIARALADQATAGESAIHYNATSGTELRITLPADTQVLSSEHEALTGAVSEIYSGQLRDLKEGDGRQDITYLANKSGWDARAVAMAALADQFSQLGDSTHSTGIAAPFYYALFRAGLPATPKTLFSVDPTTVEGIWKRAIEQGVISKGLADALPNARERFQQLGSESILSNPAILGPSSVKELLDVSGLDNDQKNQFAELYSTHRTDMPGLWSSVQKNLGKPVAERLQIDGKLAFLTINNAGLINRLHEQAGNTGISSPVDLAMSGFHRPTKWLELLQGNISIPSEIPGENSDIRRENYARYMAAQVRLSYPTASIAEMIGNGDIPLHEVSLNGTSAGPDAVHAFLLEHQDNFEVGVQPVQQFIAEHKLQATDAVIYQVKRLQRAYQITPSDQALAGLLKRGIDAAYHVVRHDRTSFIRDFTEDLGGKEAATQTYDRSVQIHNAVLNIVLGYQTARTAPAIGVHSPANTIDPAPSNTEHIIATATLETMFDSMDYCTCNHCRSILSPAAYLVNLLQFLDTRAANPLQPAHYTDPESNLQKQVTALDILLGNETAGIIGIRPDIQHLPLSCENTNTALPYIDVVNETLEYFVANTAQKYSLKGYYGYDSGKIASEDLLACPQHVTSAAYTALRDQHFPQPLPFDHALEHLRRYFSTLKVPLALAMERLRKDDRINIDRNVSTPPPETDYAWNDILIEELALSRMEYQLLTSSPAPVAGLLKDIYGLPTSMSDGDALAALSNAKNFAHRNDISYDDLFALLRTRFINPNADLIPKLERLGVEFSILKKLHDTPQGISDADFNQLLPAGPDAIDVAMYGADRIAWEADHRNTAKVIRNWLNTNDTYAKVMGLITMTALDTTTSGTRFEQAEFRHAQPAASASDTSNRLTNVEFSRLMRFIRLWKKLGWTIEHTDAAIQALFNQDLHPLATSDLGTLAKLDSGFQTLLPRLGILKRIMRSLSLTVERDLPSLLTCWSSIDTHGDTSLYRQLFLNPAILSLDPIFSDNGYGSFPSQTNQPLTTHKAAICAGLNLGSEEFQLIFDDLNLQTNAELTIANISAIYRRGWLARKLNLSVQTFLKLVKFSGLDPFAAPSAIDPQLLKLITLVNSMKGSLIKPESALHLIWNQDPNGKYAPNADQVAKVAQSLRKALSSVEAEFSPGNDPDGSTSRAKMALVYGEDNTNLFFSFLDRSFVTEVEYTQETDLTTKVDYSQTNAALEQSILDKTNSQMSYAAADKKLVFTGVLTQDTCSTLKQLPGISNAFSKALDQLLAANRMVVDANLEQPIVSIAPEQIRYDDFRKRLSFSGVLTDDLRTQLEQAQINGANVSQDFQQALSKLQEKQKLVVDPLFNTYPALKALYKAYVADTLHTPSEKRASLLQAVLPALIIARKKQLAIQVAATAAGSELAYAQALLDGATEPYPIHAADSTSHPALLDWLSMETPGLSVRFYAQDPATDSAITGVPGTTANLHYASGGSNTLPNHPSPGSAADPICGVWSGFLEAPETGFFNIRIETDAGAEVTLRLNQQNIELTHSGTAWSNSTPVALTAGRLHLLSLTAKKVRTLFNVQWKGGRAIQSYQTIPARHLYPDFQAPLSRFLKAASLATLTGLGAEEMAFLTTHPDYRIDNQGWLNATPTAGDPVIANRVSLRKAFEALLGYARIKQALAPADDRLLHVMRDPVDAKNSNLLQTLTAWDDDALKKLLIHFGHSINGVPDYTALTHLDTFVRIDDAYAIIRKIGTDAATLLQVTTNAPSETHVSTLQFALQARYEPADWRALIKPINDEMRRLRRDALVAYILLKMRNNPQSSHIDSTERLFEYFLMDVAMEPCMQTSRISHAISSVQLFIERCIMNLEPAVSPDAIAQNQWGWMKRYRVWEANRKVYLYPENWLEPELRDDKSPFFKEIESELLQSDITEDTASTALLNYLSKLEEVAKLEPCGIYHDTETGTDHVVARTAGALRKYYYRRLEDGAWTPWEQIKLDIEDNPIIPVLWKGRLMLFWLKLIKQSPLSSPNLANGTATPPNTVADINPNQVLSNNPVRIDVHAILCWSELFNGKWQPTRTSDVSNPIWLGQFGTTGGDTFDRANAWMSAEKVGATLRVYISTQQRTRYFALFNTHSIPVADDDMPFTPPPAASWGPYRNIIINNDNLRADYFGALVTTTSNDKSRILLSTAQSTHASIVIPTHDYRSDWNAPFFYSDSNHSFFVMTSTKPVSVKRYGKYALDGNSYHEAQPVWMSIEPPTPQAKRDAKIEEKLMISENAQMRSAFESDRSIFFNGKLIGPSGTLQDLNLK